MPQSPHSSLGTAFSRVVVLGASAGGGKALRTVLQPLPANYPWPLLVAQHIGDRGSDTMVALLDDDLQLTVREGCPGESLAPGTVYLAPAGYHMLLESDFHLALSQDERVHHCRPAIDPLFISSAGVCRSRLIAVLLSGANTDGAVGLERALNAGALTLVQDPKEAEFPRMPAAAIDLRSKSHSGKNHRVCSAARISETLLEEAVQSDLLMIHATASPS